MSFNKSKLFLKVTFTQDTDKKYWKIALTIQISKLKLYIKFLKNDRLKRPNIQITDQEGSWQSLV